MRNLANRTSNISRINVLILSLSAMSIGACLNINWHISIIWLLGNSVKYFSSTYKSLRIYLQTTKFSKRHKVLALFLFFCAFSSICAFCTKYLCFFGKCLYHLEIFFVLTNLLLYTKITINQNMKMKIIY